MAHYATVTSTAPLKVVEDGADTSVNATKNALYTPTVGDRVVVERIRLDHAGAGSIWIHGKEG